MPSTTRTIPPHPQTVHVCAHGHSLIEHTEDRCPVCRRDERIAWLERELARLEAKAV